MYWVGMLVGAALPAYILTALCGRFLFRNDPPDAKALKASVVALFLCALLAGIGMADGQGFNFTAGLWYIPGIALSYLIVRRSYRKRWIDDDDVFD